MEAPFTFFYMKFTFFTYCFYDMISEFSECFGITPLLYFAIGFIVFVSL